jgi:hypothetical protein
VRSISKPALTLTTSNLESKFWKKKWNACKKRMLSSLSKQIRLSTDDRLPFAGQPTRIAMKSSWEKVSSGMDQLFFTPFVKDESAYDRAQAIETFLTANGWTWDEVLLCIEKEPVNGYSEVRN